LQRKHFQGRVISVFSTGRGEDDVGEDDGLVSATDEARDPHSDAPATAPPPPGIRDG
ncbi:unnamed protein product, partial [Musa hybrid cultivar]